MMINRCDRSNRVPNLIAQYCCQSRRFLRIGLIATPAASVTPLASCCIGTIALLTLPAIAQATSIPSRFVLAQQVIRNLPPPPTIDFGTQPLPSQAPQQLPSQLPVLAPPPASTRELDFQAPPANVPTFSTNSQRYLVYINGDSSLLLEQVKRVEPTAFRRQYSGRVVIQAGSFNSEPNAQQRVRELESQGIGAQVAAVAAGQEIGNLAAGAIPGNTVRSRAYFVVIPGRREDLNRITNRLVQMGVRRSAVRSRQAPLGSHVAIGPFADRGVAEGLSSNLQDSGMDARVYYGR